MIKLNEIFVGKENNLTFIRTVAAISVIYGHSFAVVKDSGMDIISHLTKGYAFSGGVAVDLFFIISGFLVTNSILNTGILKYFIARFLRIFPALWIMLLLTVFVMGSIISELPLLEYLSSQETWQYFRNIFFLYDGAFFLPGVFSENHNQAINGSVWSIFVEVRLYILVAILYLIGILRKKFLFNILFIISIVLIWFHQISIPYIGTNSTSLHVSFLFFLGVFIYLNKEDIVVSPILLLIALLYASTTIGTSQFGIAYIFILITFFITVSFFSHFSKFDKFGDPSYGIYLYGWPIQNLMVYIFPEFNVYEIAIVSILICIGLGYISWHLIEKFFISKRNILYMYADKTLTFYKKGINYDK